MNKHDKTSEKQNDLLPPNTSWPDVLEEKLTPSEDTTGKWVASTTSFERKGLRFGMESSPASVDVKGSMRAEERERETEKQKTEESEEQRKMWDSESDNNKRKACRTKSRSRCWLERDGRGDSSPAHAVAAGSPVVPDCMEGWKVGCRSKRSLSIFTALWTEEKSLVNKSIIQPRKLLDYSVYPGLFWQITIWS